MKRRDCSDCKFFVADPRENYGICKNVRSRLTYTDLERRSGNCGPRGKSFKPASPVYTALEKERRSLRKYLWASGVYCGLASFDAMMAGFNAADHNITIAISLGVGSAVLFAFTVAFGHFYIKGRKDNGAAWKAFEESKKNPAGAGSAAGVGTAANATFYITTGGSLTFTAPASPSITIPAHWIQRSPNIFFDPMTGMLHQLSGGATIIPEETPVVADAGVQIGEQLAWRAWRLDGDNLKSLFTETEWPSDKALEGKIALDHLQGEGGGIHAFSRMVDAMEYSRTIFNPQVPNATSVIGTVLLYGLTVDHELGFRAEYARVNSIDGLMGQNITPQAEVEVLSKLRAKYLAWKDKA